MQKFFILIVFATGLFASEFNQAVEDYNHGDYIKALNTFFVLAKEDDAKS